MTVQSTYNDQSAIQARAGQLIGDMYGSQTVGRGVGLGAAKVITITVDTAADDTAYTYTINGATILFTSGTGATKATIATGLALASNVNSTAGAVMTAASTTTTVVLTGIARGDDFAHVNADANLTSVVTTAASDPTDLPFGCGVQNHASRDGHVQLPALGTAKIMTATPTHVNATSYGLTLTFDSTGDGENQVYTAFMITDASATVKEILDSLTIQLNAALPANTVLVADDDAIMTLTSEQAGMNFELTSAASTTGTWTLATTTANVREPFAGVSVHNQRAEAEDSDGVYAGGSMANIAEQNVKMWVLLDASQTPTIGDAVFMRATAGASEQAGAFRTAQDSTDCVPCPHCSWIVPSDGTAYGTGLDGNLIGALRVQTTGRVA